MNKIIYLIVFFICIGNMYGATIKAKDGTYSTDALTTAVNKQLSEIAEKLNDEPMVKLAGNQEEFSLANGNASASNIIVGSLYSGLDAGIAAIGFTGGAAAYNPTKIGDIPDDVKDGKDTFAGAAFGGVGVSAIYNGDNLPNIPMRGLMFETKFAYYSTDGFMDTNIEYRSLLLGAGVRYKLASLPVQQQVFRLRALTVGTGLYYAQSDIDFDETTIKKNSDPEDVEGETVITETSTELDYTVANKAVIIPIEAVTSANALYFLNIIAGTGFDLVLGQTKSTVTSNTQIEVYKDGSFQTPSSAPDMKLTNAETKKMPAILRYKLIFGLGLNIGPTRIELPVAYYPSNGLAASLVLGASF